MDLWLHDPVTKTYLECLKAYSEQCDEVVTGRHFIKKTNEETLNALMKNEGAKTASNFFANPASVFINFNMIKKPEGEENEA